MSTNKPKAANENSRRGFLLGAGLASAAGAAVVATGRGSLQTPVPKATAKLDERGGGGYHVTDHVKRYYRSTLV